jgi:cell division septation protein DedD
VISAPPAANAQSGNLTTSSAPSPAAPQGVTPQSPAAQIATPASTPPQTIVRQQAPRPATPAATPPAAVPSSEEAPRTAAPAPQQRPQPQRVAAAPAADAPAAAGGGFVVQLAAPGSENEARSVFSSLQRRFPDELGGQRPQIRKAEVNGREVFRLRVGPMSRESATDLCTRLKGRGGQCFVAGN